MCGPGFAPWAVFHATSMFRHRCATRRQIGESSPPKLSLRARWADHTREPRSPISMYNAISATAPRCEKRRPRALHNQRSNISVNNRLRAPTRGSGGPDKPLAKGDLPWSHPPLAQQARQAHKASSLIARLQPHRHHLLRPHRSKASTENSSTQRSIAARHPCPRLLPKSCACG